MLDRVPEAMRGFVGAAFAMDAVELTHYADASFEYAGQVQEAAYLFYLDDQCPTHFQIDLPENAVYAVDVIDTWEMTRKTVTKEASGKFDVRLPGKEYMAILARKMG